MKNEYFKEKLTWLRLWLTILVTMVSACFAWLINNFNQLNKFLIISDIILIIGFFMALLSINQKIRNYIEYMGIEENKNE